MRKLMASFAVASMIVTMYAQIGACPCELLFTGTGTYGCINLYTQHGTKKALFSGRFCVNHNFVRII